MEIIKKEKKQQNIYLYTLCHDIVNTGISFDLNIPYHKKINKIRIVDITVEGANANNNLMLIQCSLFEKLIPLREIVAGLYPHFNPIIIKNNSLKTGTYILYVMNSNDLTLLNAGGITMILEIYYD